MSQEILNQLQTLTRNVIGFASLDYVNQYGEHAIHVINLGANYDNVLEKSRQQLLAMMEIDYGFAVIAPEARNEDGLLTLTDSRIIHVGIHATDAYTALAARELLLSIYNSINNRLQGRDNDAYTKTETYTSIMHGIKLHDEQGTFELSGMAHSKRIICEGVYPTRNSRPKTIAKAALRKQLAMGKWKTFRIDCTVSITRKGETLCFGDLARLAESSELVTA